MAQDKKYHEQYERMKRWYSRFKSINETKKHDMPTDYYQDEVYAFFINCYHLKDWLKNDLYCHVGGEEIEEFVTNSESLRICGDICNGSKHLILTKPKNNSETRIGSRHFSLNLGGWGPIIHIEYDVVIGDKVYDAFTLATKCINEWEVFLNQHNLL